MCIAYMVLYGTKFLRSKIFSGSHVYLSLQLHVPIFAFSAVLWHCSCVILVASCNFVLFSILGGTKCLDSSYQAHRKRMCVCVPFISSPLAIEESTSSEVVLLLQCTVK